MSKRKANIYIKFQLYKVNIDVIILVAVTGNTFFSNIDYLF